MTYSFVFIYIFPPATGTQLGVGASLGATSTRDAAALNLAGCCYAGLGDRGTAATFFERAVIAAPYGNFFLFFLLRHHFGPFLAHHLPFFIFMHRVDGNKDQSTVCSPAKELQRRSHTHTRAQFSPAVLCRRTRAVRCTFTWCPCVSDADWGLQSDVMTNSRLQATATATAPAPPDPRGHCW